jgi:hypothetical protein
MTSILNKMLFNFPKYETVSCDMKNSLDKYTLSNEMYREFLKPDLNIEPEILRVEIEQKKPEILRVEIEQKKTSILKVEKDDSLFWCLYIHKYGEFDYIQIESRYKNREIEEKFKVIEHLKIHSLKPMKMTKIGTQEIMGDLMTNNQTSLYSVNGICSYYDIHLFIVCENKRSYIEYNPGTGTGTHCIIYKNSSLLCEKRTKYSLELHVSDSLITKIKEDYLKFENYNKPLRGISSYKLIELELIAEKLSCDGDKIKLKKDELYNMICSKIM